MKEQLFEWTRERKIALCNIFDDDKEITKLLQQKKIYNKEIEKIALDIKIIKDQLKEEVIKKNIQKELLTPEGMSSPAENFIERIKESRRISIWMAKAGKAKMHKGKEIHRLKKLITPINNTVKKRKHILSQEFCKNCETKQENSPQKE